jgi:cobyrinic acid a,c-diamide synthase
MSAPGLIIAAPRSGAGKTTVALGLMRALTARGLIVQPFKCGPDYIDPAFHHAATGRPSFNLDSWAMSDAMIAGFVAEAANADIAVVEGVMGLFDGAAGRGFAGRGATADIAALLGWPVILVLDVSGQTETAAAVALGCARYRADVTVAGVILNRVASARHAALIAPAFDEIGMRIFGALPREDRLVLPERHLGLVQASEHAALAAYLGQLGKAADRCLDLDGIIAAARPAASPTIANDAAIRLCAPAPPGQRIALAQDQAFSFIYPHVLSAWRAAGAEIMPFSPLENEAPDGDADAVWLPGGYPELHAGRLAAGADFRDGLRKCAERNLPVHGECGGYMVLGEGLEDAGGARHAMAGLLSLETSFARRRLSLGYRRARLLAPSALGQAGTEVIGHEFHYATMISSRDAPFVSCCDAAGSPMDEQGARRGSVTGTFFHAISTMVTAPGH